MIEVWPVIHVRDGLQTLQNTNIAMAAGCHGIMLISMHGDDDILDPIAAHLRIHFPGIRIGVNYLTMKAPDALMRSQSEGYAATWTDRQEFTCGKPTNDAFHMRANLRAGHLFFAAVAFKGQAADLMPGYSARIAADGGLIPTTSGSKTGVAPDVEKIAGMRRSLKPDQPLAIASGVSPENIGSFAPLVSHILVSTGVSKSFYEFDAYKLGCLMAQVR